MKLTQREQNLMRATITVARHSNEPSRHGAMIVKRGLPISRGWNKAKTHPAAIHYYSKCIHAELAALIGVNKIDLRGTHIYVARIMRSKGAPLGMSRPCPQCMKMIVSAGIKRIYFTNKIGNTEVIKL